MSCDARGAPRHTIMTLLRRASVATSHRYAPCALTQGGKLQDSVDAATKGDTVLLEGWVDKLDASGSMRKLLCLTPGHLLLLDSANELPDRARSQHEQAAIVFCDGVEVSHGFADCGGRHAHCGTVEHRFQNAGCTLYLYFLLLAEQYHGISAAPVCCSRCVWLRGRPAAGSKVTPSSMK